MGLLCVVVFDLIGLVRGEVSRHWMFMMAPLAIAGAGLLRTRGEWAMLGALGGLAIQASITLSMVACM